LAGERPELFRSLIVHEPPLFGLVKDEPNAQAALATVQDRITAVVEMLTAGNFAGGARQFVETIAIGPGAWAALPQEVRDTFVFNAPTWLDEVRDPEWMEIDLARLRNFLAPALLTMGGQSPPFFPLVVSRIARALPKAERQTFFGAGHVPHLSHPEEHVRVVMSFIERAAAVQRPSTH
jgi:pimeloyl-ACP methyl ester carboxylesterase